MLILADNYSSKCTYPSNCVFSLFLLCFETELTFRLFLFREAGLNVSLFSASALQKQRSDTLIIRVNINLLYKQHLFWYYHCCSDILHVGQKE